MLVSIITSSTTWGAERSSWCSNFLTSCNSTLQVVAGPHSCLVTSWQQMLDLFERADRPPPARRSPVFAWICAEQQAGLSKSGHSLARLSFLIGGLSLHTGQHQLYDPLYHLATNFRAYVGLVHNVHKAHCPFKCLFSPFKQLFLAVVLSTHIQVQGQGSKAQPYTNRNIGAPDQNCIKEYKIILIVGRKYVQ